MYWLPFHLVSICVLNSLYDGLLSFHTYKPKSLSCQCIMILVFLECKPEGFSIALRNRGGPIHNQIECMGEARKKGSWVEKDKGKKRGNFPSGELDLSPLSGKSCLGCLGHTISFLLTCFQHPKAHQNGKYF